MIIIGQLTFFRDLYGSSFIFFVFLRNVFKDQIKKYKQMKKNHVLLMVAAILMLSGATSKAQGQDFSTKKAPPKVKVMTLQGPAAVSRDGASLQTTTSSKEKVRKLHSTNPIKDKGTKQSPAASANERDGKLLPLTERKVPRPLPSAHSNAARSIRNSGGEVVDEHGIITSPAEGDRKVYLRSGMCYNNDNGFTTMEQSGSVQIVECSDGTVYIRNILSNYPTDTWVKGTREGNTITIPSRQPIYYNPIADCTFSLRWGVSDEIGFSNYDDYNNGNFTFAVDEAEGTISLENSSESLFMGLFWDDNDAFAWSGDYETVWTYQGVYEPLPVITVTPPAGLQTESWYAKGHTLANSDADPQLFKHNVSVGFADNEVYVKGLFADYPDAWMRGEIDGMNITFAGLQLQGSHDDATVYAVGYDSGDLTDFRMFYDADAQTMSSTSELLVNADTDNVRAEMHFIDLALSKDDPFAPIETLPYANGFDTTDEWDWFTVIDANDDGSTWGRFDGEASYRYNSDNDADDWLISPAIRLEAGKTYSFSIDAHGSTDVYIERIEVKLGDAPTAEAMTTYVIEPTELETDIPLTLNNKFITVSETGYYHFGIHAISDYDHASLRVDNLLVDETILTAPAAVSDLTVTAAAEEPVATVSFTAPTKNIGGEPLTANLTRIELLRDNEVIHTFEDVAPGTPLTYVDDDPELLGISYRYQVVAYNADGQGDKSEVVTVRLYYVYDIPYVADFTQDAVGGQFTQIDANDDGRRWEWDGGTHATYEYNSDLNADDYLVSPALHFDAGKSYNIVVDAGSAGYTERFEVLVGREPTVEGLNVKVLENCEVTNEDSRDFEAAFRAEETGVYHVAIHCISDADMYELWINKVTVEYAPEPTAPAVPQLTVTPGEKGAKQATIAIQAPTTSVDGNALSADLTKIELYRGSDVIHEFENVAPGTLLTYIDTDIIESGEYTYQAIPYNVDGIGVKSEKVTAYIGQDIPQYVRNVKATDQQSSVLLSWDAVEETGRNGGYVNPDDVEYVIYACFPNSTMPDGEVASVKGANSCVLDFVTNEGDQGFQMWFVVARNEAGESYMEDPSSATILTGESYELPLVEGFAGGSLHYYWDSNSFPMSFSQASDDDGMAMALTAQEAGDIFLKSGKLNLKDAINPTLLIDAVGFGVNSVDLMGSMNGGEDVKLATETIDNTGYKTIKVNLNSLKDCNYAQVGLVATITNPTIVDWWGEIEEEGDAIVIDNIRIIDYLKHNLSVELSAPADVQAGKKTTITATVTNWGEEAAKDFTVTIKVGDDVLLQETVDKALAPFTSLQFAADLATSVFDEGGDRTIQVSVDYSVDMKMEDNQAEAVITIGEAEAPAPENLTAEDKGDAGVELDWNAPAAEPVDHIETFDDTDVFNPFSIGGITATEHNGSIGEWTLYDGNGEEVYSWNNISYDNQYAPSAWMAFDIAEAGFTNETGYSGSQVMLSMCPVPDDTGTAAPADHWLISPELPGTEQEICFYLRAITSRYGSESFEVLVSKTDNQPGSFEMVESFLTDQEVWSPFYVTLPEGAKYFAIRHTSTDVFGVMVDDVKFNYAGEVSKYNIYDDKQLVATVENGVTTYTFAAGQIADGEHTFAVTAVYANGQESKPAMVTILVTSDIRQITADGHPVDIYTLDGKLVRRQAKSLDGLRGVYVIDGHQVIVR